MSSQPVSLASLDEWSAQRSAWLPPLRTSGLRIDTIGPNSEIRTTSITQSRLLWLGWACPADGSQIGSGRGARSHFDGRAQGLRPR